MGYPLKRHALALIRRLEFVPLFFWRILVLRIGGFLWRFLVQRVGSFLAQLFLTLLAIQALAQLLEVPRDFPAKTIGDLMLRTSEPLRPGEVVVVRPDGTLRKRVCAFDSELSVHSRQNLRAYSVLLEPDFPLREAVSWLKDTFAGDMRTEVRFRTEAEAFHLGARPKIWPSCEAEVRRTVEGGDCPAVVDASVKIVDVETGEPLFQGARLKPYCIYIPGLSDDIPRVELKVPFSATVATTLGLLEVAPIEPSEDAQHEEARGSERNAGRR